MIRLPTSISPRSYTCFRYGLTSLRGSGISIYNSEVNQCEGKTNFLDELDQAGEAPQMVLQLVLQLVLL